MTLFVISLVHRIRGYRTLPFFLFVLIPLPSPRLSVLHSLPKAKPRAREIPQCAVFPGVSIRSWTPALYIASLFSQGSLILAGNKK